MKGGLSFNGSYSFKKSVHLPCACPAGTSVKNIAKWAQAIRKSRERAQLLFQKYDYGRACYTPTGLPRTCNMRCGTCGLLLRPQLEGRTGVQRWGA